MARLCKANLILHHDSYRYINRRSRLADVLFRFAGARAMHIVLCEDMSRRLYRQYPSAMRRIVIANAASTDEPAHSPGERQAPRAIGFISNITRAKGIFEFLTVAERVHQLRPEVRAVLAGPLHEKAIERALSERLRAAPWIEYVGPLYGNDKSRFYGAIDVLVFPTRHADEADPNVVNEASAHGVVVISRSRGCISEMLWAGGGVSIDDDADFEALAERTIVRWCDEPESFALVSRAAIGSHLAASQIHRKRLAGLVDDLTGPMAPLTR
jgi:glycosyltransferase involved in cell wall biosynthesis